MESDLEDWPCPYLDACDNLKYLCARTPQMAEYYPRAFCEDRYAECAGFMIATALGPEGVPLGILPTDTFRAVKIISLHGKAV